VWPPANLNLSIAHRIGELDRHPQTVRAATASKLRSFVALTTAWSAICDVASPCVVVATTTVASISDGCSPNASKYLLKAASERRLQCDVGRADSSAVNVTRPCWWTDLKRSIRIGTKPTPLPLTMNSPTPTQQRSTRQGRMARKVAAER
jgi:hypothetical protein